MKYQEVYYIDGIGMIYSVADNNGMKWFEFQDEDKKVTLKDLNLRSLIFAINLPEPLNSNCLKWFQLALNPEVI